MHEDPQVPNYVDAATLRATCVLKEGLCIAIEPMLSVGRGRRASPTTTGPSSPRTASLSAHWEDSVAVTKDGPLVLTRA